MGPSPREHARVRRQGPRRGRPRRVEADARARPARRASGWWGARSRGGPGGRRRRCPARSGAILGEPGGGSGRACSRHSASRSAAQSEAARIGTRPATTGKLDPDQPAEAVGVPLQRRDQSRRDAQRHQPARPGRRSAGTPTSSGGSSVSAQSSRASRASRPAAARPRRPRHEDDAQRQEEAQVGQRDQPDEMAAHPVEMIRVECLLAHDEGPDLEQPRDQPAPGGQDQERPGAAGRTSRAREGSRSSRPPGAFSEPDSGWSSAGPHHLGGLV